MGPRSPVPTADGRQQCSQCGTFKPVTDFEPARHRACGITAMCRGCLKRARVAGAELRRMQDAWSERQYAPTPVADYKPPLDPIPEAHRKTEDHFRAIDAQRRRMRLAR